MSTRSLRNRLADTTNIWPGFVDVLATLLIVIIFVLMVFTVSQIYLSDAISGRDKALQDLRTQINELSKILVIEKQDKEKAQSSLAQTQQQLEENYQHIKDFNVKSISAGYLCSTCDPFLLLICELFKVNINHNYCGYKMKYRINNAVKTLNFKSDRGNFTAC